jgi:Spy/CpxP family protein refolding chaperone
MMRKHGEIRLLVLLLLLFWLVPAAHAEGPKKDAPGVKQGQMSERMKQARSRLLQKRVGLEGATLEKVEQVLSTFDAKRRQLHKQKKDVRKSVRALLESDSDEQAQYESTIQTMRELHSQTSKLREAQMKAIAPHLTPKQQVKFMVAIRKFRERRNRMKQQMKRGHRRGVRGHGRHEGAQEGRPQGRHRQGGAGTERPPEHPPRNDFEGDDGWF